MANSFNVPFDYNPTSVSVKTSSYTIPAGSYAYVINSCSGDFTIDGTAAQLSPDGFTNTNLTTTASTADYTITVNGFYTINMQGSNYTGTNSDGIIEISQNGSNFYQVSSLTYSGGAAINHYVNVYLEKGNVVRTYKSASHNTWTSQMTGCRESIVSGGFWVPTGTQLNGDRYIVMLFNEIS